MAQDPFRFVGQSNDPTLAKRVLSATAAADALPGTLSKQVLSNIQSGRNAQGVADATMARKRLELGLLRSGAPGSAAGDRGRGAEISLGRQLTNYELAAKQGLYPTAKPGESLTVLGAEGAGRPMIAGKTLSQLAARAGKMDTTSTKEDEIVPTPSGSAFPLKKRQTIGKQVTTPDIRGPYDYINLPRTGVARPQQAPRELKPVIESGGKTWYRVPGTEMYVTDPPKPATK